MDLLNDSEGVIFLCSPDRGITSNVLKREEIELFDVFYKK